MLQIVDIADMNYVLNEAKGEQFLKIYQRGVPGPQLFLVHFILY